MYRASVGRRRGGAGWDPTRANASPGIRVNSAEQASTNAQLKVNAGARGTGTLVSLMRDQSLDCEVGRRVHKLVGLALERGEGPAALVSLSAEVFTSWPTTRALAPSARLKVVTAAAVYLGRCVPEGYELVGVEEPVGGGVADLLWRKRGGTRILIDEMKTGSSEPGDLAVSLQVERLFRGGVAQWGSRFAGVRVLPLGSVRRAWLKTEGGIEQPIVTAGLEVH
jgi:hypothetical protein